MKKIIGVALAALIGSVAIGTTVPADAADITAENFVAAFRDNYTGYTYKNTMNMEKFVAALEDNYTGYTYKNVTNQEKFVSALEDDYTPEMYDSIMEKGRFAALHEEGGREEAVADYLSQPSSANRTADSGMATEKVR